ncbi:MAG: RelA/SpoT family protein [Methylotenera sp.]|nr:RelA/SpoT family protein [Methylotenera sp.]
MITLHTETEQIRREIESMLYGLGFLCRVFGRSKSCDSLNKKLKRDPDKYKLGGRLIQDLIGIRVVLYFQEDIEIVKKILCMKYVFDSASSTIDLPDTDQFCVSRFNLVFKIPDQYSKEFIRQTKGNPIDTSFEIQLRSMLSEGWHEVEHDLRYKSKDSWAGQHDLSRALNGIMATLETSEWTMNRIFDDLAYRHYKNKNWSGMLQNKFRMRVEAKLSDNLTALFDGDNNIAKEMFRVEKSLLILKIQAIYLNLPINLDNLIYVWNYYFFKNTKIHELTPKLILEMLNDNEGVQSFV